MIRASGFVLDRGCIEDSRIQKLCGVEEMKDVSWGVSMCRVRGLNAAFVDQFFVVKSANEFYLTWCWWIKGGISWCLACVSLGAMPKAICNADVGPWWETSLAEPWMEDDTVIKNACCIWFPQTSVLLCTWALWWFAWFLAEQRSSIPRRYWSARSSCATRTRTSLRLKSLSHENSSLSICATDTDTSSHLAWLGRYLFCGFNAAVRFFRGCDLLWLISWSLFRCGVSSFWFACSSQSDRVLGCDEASSFWQLVQTSAKSIMCACWFSTAWSSASSWAGSLLRTALALFPTERRCVSAFVCLKHVNLDASSLSSACLCLSTYASHMLNSIKGLCW